MRADPMYDCVIATRATFVVTQQQWCSPAAITEVLHLVRLPPAKRAENATCCSRPRTASADS